ncbi:MAG: carboxymuconolactone decarboxylase family protein [Azospirillaceae bacterium]
MQPRLNAQAAAPDAIKAVLGLETYVRGCGLEHSLIELVKIRVSQINGCAYCLDMHVRDARASGESDQRLAVLAAWWESPAFTERERAALAWAETLTRIADRGAPDSVYQPLAAQFSETEIVNLSLAIATINTWNRIAIGFHNVHPMDEAPLARSA